MHMLRVGVLMGGMSIEKEVSFNSGRTVCDHLDTARYTVVPIFQTGNGTLYILPWKFLHRGKISDFQDRLTTEAQEISWDDLKKLVDFVYIATHGRYAEDGTLQGFLEVLGIPYLGSDVLSSALGMDKHMQKKFLSMHGIAVPRGITISPTRIEELQYDITPVLAELSLVLSQPTHQEQITSATETSADRTTFFPLIIKPYKEGSSLGVSVVHTQEELYPALVKAMTAAPGKKQAVLIEEKIAGMEFSCIIITDYKMGTWKPLPPTEIDIEKNTEFYDYEQKYMPGRATKFTPPRTTPEIVKKIQDVCVQVSQALGFSNISRVDGFVTPDEKIVIVDPNSLSGMAPSSFLFREAAELNMSHTQLINHLIETELQNYGMLDAIIEQEKKKADQMLTKKIRVAVLMGGATNEKEISLESGRNVTYKLSPQKYEVLPIFVSSKLELFKLNQSLLVRNSTKEIEERINPELQISWSDLPKITDFVFLGLHGGHGENGAIQGALEMLGLPYNGSSVLASALCMDKYKSCQFLKHQGFDVPNQLLISQTEWHTHKAELTKQISQNIGFPVIVKPHDDGCSVLVQKVKKEEDLDAAIELLFSHGKDDALIENCIIGTELTVGVIGNDKAQALPPSQVVVTGDILSIEEKFLPGAGENQTPAKLPAESIQFVQRMIEQMFMALGCKGYSRIDCFYQSPEQSPTGKERLIFLELNSLPGLTPATCLFHQAAEVGIKPMDFIDLIVQLGLEEHAPHLLSMLYTANQTPRIKDSIISSAPTEVTHEHIVQQQIIPEITDHKKATKEKTTHKQNLKAKNETP
jgi:D-alanine-D-alanine ligase